MDVRLPRLGEGADTGTVAAIFVKEGESVRKEQALLELESEKAVASIPTPQAGVISKIHVREGDQIKVGDLIVSVSEDGAPQPSQPVPVSAPQPPKAAPAQPAAQPSSFTIPEPSTSEFAPPASPSIRKIARELGIDLRRVRGSERGGRIVLADVRTYVQQLQQRAFQPQAGAPPAEQKVVAEKIDFSKWGPVSRKKMSTIRKTISQRMVQSWTTLPRITQFDEADITALNDLRKKYAPAYDKQGAKLTLTPFIIACLARVLKEYPIFNSSYDESSGEIVYKEYYHIGIAVDTEHGLLVPVLRDVDKKDLRTLSIELNTIAGKARDRTLSLEEMQGGTFSLSNQGGIGGSSFTPIINKPEVAILGMGRGSLKPMVHNKNIEPRLMLPLGLSYDHRVIDGADAARFITALVRSIETFDEDAVRLASVKSPKGAKKGKK